MATSTTLASSYRSQRPESALRRGVQIVEFDARQANPEPVELEEAEVLLEEYLSPRRLQEITGVEDLKKVKKLNLQVDTTETSLGNFGHMLPNLKELRLDDSTIPSLRDLGSSLSELHTLWMQRSCLEELDGISSMVNLVELFLSYNSLTDLSPVGLCDHLEVLDVEGNNIEDISQVLFLSTCPSLSRLTLEGNPVCLLAHPESTELDYDYRQTVHLSLPNLLYLDDELLRDNTATNKPQESLATDWAYLDELKRDVLLGSTLNTIGDDVTESHVPSSKSRPGSVSLRPGSSLRPRTSIRPTTSRRQLVSRAGFHDDALSTDSPVFRPWTSYASPKSAVATTPIDENEEFVDSSSGLTSGQVVCGNPGKALLARKKQSPTPPNCDATLPRHKLELTPETEETRLMSELSAWRKHHKLVLKRIEEDQAPQVLKVTPGELASDTESDDGVPAEFTPLPAQDRSSYQLTTLTVTPPQDGARSSGRDFRHRKYSAQTTTVPSANPHSQKPVVSHGYGSNPKLDESFEMEPESPERRDQQCSPDSGFSSAMSPSGSGADGQQMTSTLPHPNHKLHHPSSPGGQRLPNQSKTPPRGSSYSGRSPQSHARPLPRLAPMPNRIT